MRSSMLLASFASVLSATAAQSTSVFGAIEGAGIPACAQGCLQNATVAEGACLSEDIKCLCTNTNYTNTLACCLSTTCSTADQQTALKANERSCSAVNVSIPNFVGCSPFGINSSVLPSFNTKTLGTAIPTDRSTVGTVEPPITSFVGTTTATGTFDGGSILTGTCSSPRFAAITGQNGLATEFPFIGCSPEFADCCPGIDPRAHAVLTKCPFDYTTTSRACCPSGWKVFSIALGSLTPCYTSANITLMPPVGNEDTPTDQAPLIFDQDIFTRKFDLAPSKSSKGLSAGAAAGIAVGIFFSAVALTLVAFFYLLRRHEARKAAIPSKQLSVRERGISMPGPLLPGNTAPPPYPERHELPSLESGGNQWHATPMSPLVPPIIPTSPLGSTGPFTPRSPLSQHGSVMAGFRAPMQLVPVEMPGDSFINAHHPAFVGAGESGDVEDDKAERDGGKVVEKNTREDGEGSPSGEVIDQRATVVGKESSDRQPTVVPASPAKRETKGDV